LITRRIKGKLNTEQLQSLKNYFQKENSIPIEQDDYIVINYVTSYPIIENEKMKSKWSIYQEDYIKELHKKIKCKQFWIHDIIQENLEPYSFKHIKWLKENDEFIKKMFYEYVTNYGNVTIVKPDGHYYTFLGEYGPDEVYEGITELK
jgi:hypothetical protein